MKAVVINHFGNPDVFEIQEIDKPVINPDQLLIKVFATSINPIDWKQRKGNHKLFLGSPFPIVLGYDVAGEVVETGTDISHFKVGDKVYGVLDNKYGGALAEFTKGHQKCFASIPENISMNQAAAYPMVSLTALQALRDKANLKAGQTVLINGASGGVGHVAVQIAKLMQLNVIAVASKQSESFVKSLEPSEFIDYNKQKISELALKVDAFFDVVGNYTFPQVKHLLKPSGIYLNLNYIDTMKKMPYYKLHQLFSKGKKAKTFLMKNNSDDLELISKWISQGLLRIRIDEEFSIHNIAAAHDYAQQGHNKGKNIVFITT